MGSWLSEREMRLVAGAEKASAATPIPTQIVSNGEYLPPKQSETQKRVERRIFELADENGKKLGLSRRQFMATGCGMAAAFLAMKEIYGTNVFQVDAAEAHHARANPGQSPEPGGAVRLRRADPLRPRRFRPQGTPRPERLCGGALEPEDQGSDPAGPSAVQIPQLRQGDLLRQRYPACAAEWGAIRRSDMVAALQRADRQDAADGQRFRRIKAPARPHRYHAQAARLDGGGR